MYPFNDMQTEPHALDEDQPILMKTYSPIDISSEVTFKAESDAIEELLIDGMQCEFVSIL